MRATFFAVCVTALGCGTGSTQGNSQPEGFISGRVLDAATGMPATGVEVSTFANTREVSVTTDMEGRYQLGPIPAGSYTVFASAMGYVTRIFTGVGVAGAAGNYPTGNVVLTRDFDMSKGDATIDGQVTTSTTAPAKGATVYVDLRPVGFDVVASAKTDMAGKFKFTGMPGAASGVLVQVNVAPYDENGDGLPDYSTASRTYTLFPGFTATGAITISAVGIPVLSSNIADSELAPMEGIVLTFGAQIRPAQSAFSLTRAGFSIGLEVTWDSAETTVTIKPAGGPLVEGQNHQFSYLVRGVSSATASGNQSFVVRAGNVTPPGNVTNLRVVSPAMMMYDGNLSNATIAWEAVNGALGYRVYGKDLQMNPAYVMVQQFAATSINGTVFFSNTFGGNNGVLAGGNKITLAVVALGNSNNEGPLSTAPTVEISDNVAPSVTSGSQQSGFGTANNTSGVSPVTISYRVSWSEAMAQGSIPTFQANDARVTATGTWSSSTVLIYTVTVPVGVNGQGPVGISGGKDTSNNTQSMIYMGSIN